MAKIKAVEVDGQIIYVQANEDLEVDDSALSGTEEDGFERKGDNTPIVNQVANSLKGLVKTMTDTTVNAISEATSAHVDQINLEFGVMLSSKAGFFVASGEAEGTVKVNITLSFPKKTETKK